MRQGLSCVLAVIRQTEGPAILAPQLCPYGEPTGRRVHVWGLNQLYIAGGAITDCAVAPTVGAAVTVPGTVCVIV